jgi:hypothetical protein
MRWEDKTQAGLTRAIRVTAIGARISLTAFVALLMGDLASQLAPRHPALLFGLTGGTVALVIGRQLGRVFRAFE